MVCNFVCLMILWGKQILAVGLSQYEMAKPLNMFNGESGVGCIMAIEVWQNHVNIVKIQIGVAQIV